MRNLRTLIDKKLIPVLTRHNTVHGRTLAEIYRECYIPHLRAVYLDTHFDPPIFFSHAPFDTTCLWEVAVQLSPSPNILPENESKPTDELHETVSAINDDFTNLATTFNVHSLLSYDDALENRFLDLCWNRNYQNLTFFGANKQEKPTLIQVHGHNSDDPRNIKDGVFALDDTFGKGDSSLWEKTSTSCLFARRPPPPPETESVNNGISLT